MLFIHPYKTNFFSHFCFPDMMTYMLNITSAIKTIRVNEIVKKTNDKVIDKVMDELSNKKDAIK